VQQHFDVRLVLQPFGFSLPLRKCNLVVIEKSPAAFSVRRSYMSRLLDRHMKG
jgi:hypothetical protein